MATNLTISDIEKKNSNIRILEVYSYERTTQDGSKKYNVYNTKTASGKMIEVKFTLEAGYPRAKKHFYLKCNCNVSECKKTGRPLIWVKEILEEEEYQATAVDRFDELMNDVK